MTLALGHQLAGFEVDALVEVFATPLALHRFPKAMAVRVQEVCRVIVARYDGEAASIWGGVADGGGLLGRVLELPGFGK